jgi:hypothetical protein
MRVFVRLEVRVVPGSFTFAETTASIPPASETPSASLRMRCWMTFRSFTSHWISDAMSEKRIVNNA